MHCCNINKSRRGIFFGSPGRSRNATVRVLADGQIHTLTDANRFYNLSHAICYSYGTDNAIELLPQSHSPLRCRSITQKQSRKSVVHTVNALARTVMTYRATYLYNHGRLQAWARGTVAPLCKCCKVFCALAITAKTYFEACFDGHLPSPGNVVTRKVFCPLIVTGETCLLRVTTKKSS